MTTPKIHTHDEAIDALCGCAATVSVLSYQEAIEGYFKLRGLPIPAASPPAREEAPAEGAGESEELFSQGYDFIATCKECGVAFDAHLRGCSNARPTALRARTSEPAREAVAWPCGPNPIGDPMEAVQHPNGRWCVEQVVDDGAICMTWFDGPYAGWRARNYARTRPAPATADKLKVAKEALERIADLGSDGEHSGDRHARCHDFARQALAALTEEG